MNKGHDEITDDSHANKNVSSKLHNPKQTNLIQVKSMVMVTQRQTFFF